MASNTNAASCFECGNPAECDHHVVPRVRGGTKTVPLCGWCHGKAHHRDGAMSTSSLMKEFHQQRKAKGLKSGTPANLTPEARAKGVRKAAINGRNRAIEEMADVTTVIVQMRDSGSTLQAIADHLNADGTVTRKGGKWATTQVLRILRRATR